ncbi:hypothetical protein L6V77_17855 [Myxococcota bacterium]|nr:hypothetical protein [Myxococcota bacterium]
MTPKFEFKVVESGEPRRDETPDAFLRRQHEGEERALTLLALDRPEPGPDFDARFSDRLAALKIIERAEHIEAAAPAMEPEVAGRLDRLLAVDCPEPSPMFDAHLRHRLRQAQTEDAGLRTVAGDVLRLPALPQRHWPSLDRAVAAGPRWRRNFKVTAALAAAALAVTFWFAGKVEDLTPPDEELDMVAHLDLLEQYDELEAFEALRDEDVFETVAALDTLLDESEGPEPAGAPPPGPAPDEKARLQ